MYRIELSLPLLYNDKSPIEIEKFDITRQELTRKFGGLTSTQVNTASALDGWWVNQGITYQDKIAIFRIDTDTFSNRFWTKYKNLLKRRFRQEEVYITVTQINVI